MAVSEVKPSGAKKALVLCSGGVDSTTLLANGRGAFWG